MKPSTLTPLLTLLLFLSHPSFSQWKWANPNPTGNDLNSLALRPNSSTYLTVGNFGTILRLNSMGSSWKILNSGTKQNLLGISFFTENKAVAVGEGYTILLTADAGDSWNKIMGYDYETQYSYYGEVLTTDSMTAYIVGNYKPILKSSDQGLTWDTVFQTTSGVNFKNIKHFGKDTLYFLGFDYLRSIYMLYRTFDGGKNFDSLDINTPLSPVWKMDFQDAQNGFMVGSDYSVNPHYIYKTKDGGLTWDTLETKTNSYNLVSIAVVDKDLLVVSDENGMFYTTTDLGKNWMKTNPFSDNYFQLNDIAFKDISKGIAVGRGGVILNTSDSSSSWFVNSYYNLGTTSGISFPTENIGYFAGDRKWLMKTSDGGQTWSNLSGSIPFISGPNGIHFINPDTGFLSGYYGTLYKTTNGGGTWDKITGIDGYNTMNTIYFLNDTMGFISGGKGDTVGTVLKTTDGGNAWSYHAVGDEYLVNVFFSSTNIGYATGGIYSGKAYKTSDGGQTWKKLNLDSLSQISALYFINDSVGFFSDGGPYIYKTTNGGNSFIKLAVPGVMEIKFYNDMIGYASGFNGYIYKTLDGGSIWYPQERITHQALTAIEIINSDKVYTGGSYGSLLYSDNGGVVCPQIDSVYKYSDSVCINNNILIKVASRNKGIFTWYFNDTTITTYVPEILYTPTKPGIQNSKVLMDNSGCKDTAFTELNVLNFPDASFSYLVMNDTVRYFAKDSTGDKYYVWNFGDGNFQYGSPNASHIYSVVGNYKITMEVSYKSYGCISKDSATVEINKAGLNELSNHNPIILFQNPSDRQFFMNLNNENSFFKELKITNTTGTVIYQTSLTNDLNNLKSNLSSGIYFITLKGENISAVRKIIIY